MRKRIQLVDNRLGVRSNVDAQSMRLATKDILDRPTHQVSSVRVRLSAMLGKFYIAQTYSLASE